MIKLIGLIELIELIELMVTRFQVMKLVDRAVFFNLKSGIPNRKAGSWMLDTGSRVLEAGHWIVSAGILIQVPAFTRPIELK